MQQHNDLTKEIRLQVIHQGNVLRTLYELRKRLDVDLPKYEQAEWESDNSRMGSYALLELRSQIDRALSDLYAAVEVFQQQTRKKKEHLEAQTRKLRLRSFRHVAQIGSLQVKHSLTKTRIACLEGQLDTAQKRLSMSGLDDMSSDDEDDLPEPSPRKENDRQTMGPTIVDSTRSSTSHKWDSTQNILSKEVIRNIDAKDDESSDGFSENTEPSLKQRALGISMVFNFTKASFKPYSSEDDESYVLPCPCLINFNASFWNVAKVRKYTHNSRKRLYDFLTHRHTQVFIIFLIIMNSITMGIGSFDFVTENPRLIDTFDSIDLGFLWIFTIELFLNFLAKGVYIFKDRWIMFDFVIISVSWIGEMAGKGNNIFIVKSFRAFRSFRSLRLVPRIRMIRGLVSAVLSTLPRMFGIIGLLSLVFYISSVYFTSLFSGKLDENGEIKSEYLTKCNITVWDDDYSDYRDKLMYFDRLDHTLLTLFQMMSLDDWPDIARVIGCFEPNVTYKSFFVFIVITDFIFINLIIAVLCDAVPRLHEGEDGQTPGKHPYMDDPLHKNMGINRRKRFLKRLNEMNETLHKIMQAQEVMQNHLSRIGPQIEPLNQQQKIRTSTTCIGTEVSRK